MADEEDCRTFPRVAAADPMRGVREYAVKGRPMSMYKELLAEAKQRYEPGHGPWSKEGDLDQVDLVFLEHWAAPARVYSDMRGLMSDTVDRLVEEIRRARGWPTPPDLDLDYEYVNKETER